MSDKHPLQQAFSNLLDEIQRHKPNDRSSLDRSYAVLLTMLEQALAYLMWYIVSVEEKDE